MNIEDKLSELGLDLQALPEEMNKSAMRKTMTRKRTIHNIGVAGKSVLITIAALILMLFAGVNTSKEFARTCVNTPLIGTISQTFIVREDIREDILGAIKYNDEVEKAIENGHLSDVGETVHGKNYPIDLTLDSVVIDDHAVNAFIKINTEMKPKRYFTIIRGRVIDLDTGEDFTLAFADVWIKELDTLYLIKINYPSARPNIAIEFDLADMGYTDPYPTTSMEHYHFEFHDVSIQKSIEFPIDWTIEVSGHEISFSKLIVSETGTMLLYKPFYGEDLELLWLDVVLEDMNGKEIGAEIQQGTDSAPYTDEEGNDFFIKMLKDIYYEDLSQFRIHVRSCEGRYPLLEKIWIDPVNNIAYFNGDSFPISQYTYDEADAICGLTDEAGNYPWTYTSYDGMNKDDLVVFMIPKKEGMPRWNSRDTLSKGLIKMLASPLRVIDGQEYYLIFEEKENLPANGTKLIYSTTRLITADFPVDQYYEVKS